MVNFTDNPKRGMSTMSWTLPIDERQSGSYQGIKLNQENKKKTVICSIRLLGFFLINSCSNVTVFLLLSKTTTTFKLLILLSSKKWYYAVSQIVLDKTNDKIRNLFCFEKIASLALDSIFLLIQCTCFACYGTSFKWFLKVMVTFQITLSYIHSVFVRSLFYC